MLTEVAGNISMGCSLIFEMQAQSGLAGLLDERAVGAIRENSETEKRTPGGPTPLLPDYTVTFALWNILSKHAMGQDAPQGGILRGPSLWIDQRSGFWEHLSHRSRYHKDFTNLESALQQLLDCHVSVRHKIQQTIKAFG